MMSSSDTGCYADGLPGPVIEVSAPKNGIEFGDCKAAAVYECSTGTLLAGKNEDRSLPIGHLAKLMTFLLAAEKIESGELSSSDTAVCSAYANSQREPQIWLGIGEKISVGELMRSVSVGNANDACVCLAEKICGSEQAYVDAANRKASLLDMSDASFSDCTGMSDETKASAADICKLCSELVKYEDFSGNFTTWMDSVRNGRAELVSRNRLIRSYKGIRGFKVCSSGASGECAAVCADRSGMTVCAVVLGAENEDDLLELSKKLLDSAFSAFEIYYPEIPEEAAEDIDVIRGVKGKCSTEFKNLSPVMIRKGEYSSINCTFDRAENVEAPVRKGCPVGSITFDIDGRIIITSAICAGEDVAEVDLGFSFKRVLYNLLHL